MLVVARSRQLNASRYPASAGCPVASGRGPWCRAAVGRWPGNTALKLTRTRCAVGGVRARSDRVGWLTLRHGQLNSAVTRPAQVALWRAVVGHGAGPRWGAGRVTLR